MHSLYTAATAGENFGCPCVSGTMAENSPVLRIRFGVSASLALRELFGEIFDEAFVSIVIG